MSGASPAVGSVVSGWVACSFDDVTLLLPMEDAGARVDVEDLVPTAQGLELGMLRWQDELWPAYRLDNELSPVTWKATPSAVALPVCANGQARGIVCDQIRTFDHPVAVSLHAIPGCLRESRSPVVALGLYETLRVGLVIRGDGMIRHLDELVGKVSRD